MDTEQTIVSHLEAEGSLTVADLVSRFGTKREQLIATNAIHRMVYRGDLQLRTVTLDDGSKADTVAIAGEARPAAG